VIAAASFEAIGKGGSLKAALAMAARIRQTRSEPIVLFTYYNPITAFGDAMLVKAAVESGVDGFLIVDLPPDEGEELRSAAAAAQLCVIPLVAPTSGPEREAMIGAQARGFIYYVSVTGVTGVTGAGVAPLSDAGRNARAISERFKIPVVVGFGIDSADKAVQAKRAGAPGVVVGTAIIRAVGEASDGPARVFRLVSEIRAGLDAAN
jgi:tryptophan synthase alpha chain